MVGEKGKKYENDYDCYWEEKEKYTTRERRRRRKEGRRRFQDNIS